MTLTINTGKLSARKAMAIKRRAKRLGLTPAKYIQQLIDDDLAISHKAQSMTWDELAAPFEKALGGLSEEELDRRVEAARAAHHRELSTNRRRA